MLSNKDAGCFNCGENSHFVDRCPKPKRQNQARLFAAEVQDADADEGQHKQGISAHDADEPGSSPSSDNNEDQVNGPQYLSDNKVIIEIYDNDDDSDGEPVTCLRRMSPNDPSNEEVVCCLYMRIAESSSDKFSAFGGDDECKDSLNEYEELRCAVLETGDLRSHEQSCNGDVSITDLLQVPALEQGHEHLDAHQEMAEEAAAEGISSWGVINTMEKFAMPEINASPRWDWSDHFRFTHRSECQPCCLYRRHIITSELEEDPGLAEARAFPGRSARRAYDDGWMSWENTIPETGVVFIGLAQEHLEATYEPLWLLNSVAQAFECSLVDDPQATVLCKQTSQVCSLINCTLQVLSAPTNSAHGHEEDTTEDLHTALARTMVRIDFAGHPLQDMWGALMHIGKHTEQSQIELHHTVEELCTLDL